MRSPASGDTSAIRTYFENRYPKRGGISSPLFRSGSLERAEIISAWLPTLAGKSLCDVGCGDGDQIARILSKGNLPERLVLQDMSDSVVDRAMERLSGYDCSVSRSIGDAFVDGFGGPHHVVIATGVTDYYRDWNRVLESLLQHTSELLIVDFPRKWKLRNIPRSMWLRQNGLEFHSASLGEVRELARRTACPAKIASSRYNWMVRMTKIRAPQ